MHFIAHRPQNCHYRVGLPIRTLRLRFAPSTQRNPLALGLSARVLHCKMYKKAEC